MGIVAFLIHLFSGVMLLLYAVRLTRIAIERLWSERLRSGLSSSASTVSLISKGAVLGFVMQGATVVLVMAAGLAGSGIVPLVSAVTLAIGADFGSALAVRFLTLPISAVGPFFLLVGGWVFLNKTQPRTKNIGQVLLGLGLLFLSLSLIRDAVAPLSALPISAGATTLLDADPILAVIVGAVLTLAMHSSLAAILAALAFAEQGTLGMVGGLAFILGCNVGSALLPLWLLRTETGEGRRVAQVVAALRVALAFVLLLGLLGASSSMVLWVSLPTVDAMLAGHVGFNMLLLLLAPFVGLVGAAFAPAVPAKTERRFSLPQDDSPEVILTALRSQVSRMLDLLSQMFENVSGENPDPENISELEHHLNQALAELREAFASMPKSASEPGDSYQTIFDFAIRIEACGDTLSGKYLLTRLEGLGANAQLSEAGQSEVTSLINQVRKGILLAQSTLWKNDLEIARQLVEHKHEVADLENTSRRGHLKRVQSGNLTSLSTSDQHLEMIAALKSVNSKLATIGYAVLDQQGALKKSRIRTKIKAVSR